MVKAFSCELGTFYDVKTLPILTESKQLKNSCKEKDVRGYVITQKNDNR